MSSYLKQTYQDEDYDNAFDELKEELERDPSVSEIFERLRENMNTKRIKLGKEPL